MFACKTITKLCSPTSFKMRPAVILGSFRTSLARTYVDVASPAKPTLEIARALPFSTRELDNNMLVILGSLGDLKASREMVKRHIMGVDGVDYDTASATFEEVDQKNKELNHVYAIPYTIAVGAAMTAAFSSFPLVFDLTTVQNFNEHFVTTDVPEAKDLETVFEVGSWSWNWMEPILGQVSFFLLCLQFSRAQIQKLGIKPYTEVVKSFRANRLAAAFPKYDAGVLKGYSKATSLFV